MQLFNKKLLTRSIERYEIPQGEVEKAQKLITGWQKALKDSDLNKTKETGIQGQFLSKFFETILGYVTQTSGGEEWNLIQEPKTNIDSQEADGALGFFTKDKVTDKTEAVIELKDAKTSLDKKQLGRANKLTPVEQAFNYLNKFDRCKWVIVSNFREIRLYCKTRGMGFYEKFEILDLDQAYEFKRFYFLLNKLNLIGGGGESLIEQLVKDTTKQEENITKQFYAHYKEIRLKVFQHLVSNNPTVGRLVLLEKTQKLLDRMVFTLVCEDTSTLLPANLIKQTYDRAMNSFSASDERVWSEFRGLFHAIDKGNDRVKPTINEYNGGLFKSDDVLDKLAIKDPIWDEIITLTKYDFESDLNVNILGHIFEQSISDLEELKAQVGDTELDHKKSLRKKQGIFYTPEYITKFIVENTVGKYLEEHPEKLETIKILDPACGSGAFLNQAHSFLLNEYKVRTELKQVEKLQKGQSLELWDTDLAENDKSILLNNLFGVDLSSESVEITKLSLWLKTARASERLQNLDNNVRCGNSLIDDPTVVGERAFNWQTEFAGVMDKGGFDVIIGNPPYGADIDDLYTWFEQHYPKTASGHKDTYKFFIDKALDLLCDGGVLGYIVPNTFVFQPKYKDLKELLEEYEHYVINLGDKVFSDAEVPVSILVVRKDKPKEKAVFADISLSQDVSVTLVSFDLEQEKQRLQSSSSIFAKGSLVIDDVFELRDAGIQYHRSNIGLQNKGGSDLYERIFQKNTSRSFPNVVSTYYGSLIDRYFITDETDEVFNLDYKSVLNDNEQVSFSAESFSKPKLLWRQTASTIKAVVSLDELWFRNTIQCAYLKPAYQEVDLHYCLAILNSKLFEYYYTQKVREQGRVFPQVKLTYLRQLPFIIGDTSSQSSLAQKANDMTILTADFKRHQDSVVSFLVDEYQITANKKIQHVAQLGWNELVEILGKQKVKLPLPQKEELQKWFRSRQKEIVELGKKVEVLNKQIDEEVFQLYQLSEAERELVLGAIRRTS